ncbi:MAG: response regulator [Acidobacteriia bacterium]|nr:response regulator [Terriglobia bacterium]
MATLIVGSTETDCALLQRLLGGIMPAMIAASDSRQALAAIPRTEIQVVICERDLPDGSWRDILRAIHMRPDPPSLIVTSRLADERLWAEVLNEGGYDVLAQPFDAQEVRRTAVLARDRWLRAHGRRAVPAAVANGVSE